VQNADDNHYPDGEQPALNIAMSKGNISFESNETGFTEENVMAICSVNESSKKNNKRYIG
jgi:hypothetical protein